MKKAVFLIHGFLTGKEDFAPLNSFLSEHYELVYFFSLPGHANKILSEFTVKDTLKNLLEEFDGIKDEYDYIDVIGYSLGGALASFLANKREFNKLVLLSPANKFLNYKVPFFKGKYYLQHLKESFFDDNRRKNFLKESLSEEIYALKLTAFNVLNKDITKAINTFLLLIDYINNHVKAINNEIIIIWGELDEIVPIQSIKYLFSKCKNKNKSVHVIDNIGHMMLYSKHNKIIIELIENFLL